MAWITPPVFVALQTLTDSVMNQLSSRLSDLFPYTTIGDTAYASATDTLSRLGIGTAGQVLQTNSGATAPEWTGLVAARQGGSATDWTVTGSTDYTPSQSLIQVGTTTITISASTTGNITVTFPNAYGNKPVVLFGYKSNLGDLGAGNFIEDLEADIITATTAKFTATLGSSGTTTVVVYWAAFGPPA